MQHKKIRHYLAIALPIFLACFFRAILAIPSLAFAQNQPPVANAGPDRNAYTGVPVVMNGSASDPDGDPILGWSWVVEQAPAPSSYRVGAADTANLTLIGYIQGDYVVSLTVTDGIDIGTDYATVHVADNLPPVAVATADNTTITVGGTVCFDGSQSYDPEGGALRYFWDFADGSPYIFDGPVSLCHVYSTTGTFAVLFGVTDVRGAIDTDVVAITVNPPVNHPPVASPTATPSSGDSPLTVQFTANATDADNDPLTYLWDFGDSTTSTQANPSHTYTAAGTYTASLTVSDSEDTASYSLTITVSPHLAFSVANASVKWVKKGTIASVDVVADLAAPIPAAGDTIMMTFDGVQLFAVPFSSFRYDATSGVYSWQGKNVNVSINFAAGTVGVHTTKTVMTGFDAANGVEVYLMLGDLDAVENIVMTSVRGDRLIYSAPAP